MLQIREYVPDIYYNSSRDFQLLAHLFDVVLNAVKTDTDQLVSLPLSVDSDDRLLDLMAFTFGLRFDRSKYTAAQIRNICSVAPELIKTKGSLRSIELLCTAVLRAEGLNDDCTIEVATNNAAITIILPANSTCKDILFEVLPYILPAGMTFNIVQVAVNTRSAIEDPVAIEDIVRYAEHAPTAALKPLNKLKDVSARGLFASSEDSLRLKDNLAQGMAIGGTRTFAIRPTSDMEAED